MRIDFKREILLPVNCFGGGAVLIERLCERGGRLCLGVDEWMIDEIADLCVVLRL